MNLDDQLNPTTLPVASHNNIKMADAAPRGRGGFGSRGDRGGERGRGRGARRGRRGPKQEEKEWQPVTKLGRLVKAGKITSMEQIYLHSLPVKEYQIVDFFLPKLKDEVMKVRNDFFTCRFWRKRSTIRYGKNLRIFDNWRNSISIKRNWGVEFGN